MAVVVWHSTSFGLIYLAEKPNKYPGEYAMLSSAVLQLHYLAVSKLPNLKQFMYFYTTLQIQCIALIPSAELSSEDASIYLIKKDMRENS